VTEEIEATARAHPEWETLQSFTARRPPLDERLAAGKAVRARRPRSGFGDYVQRRRGDAALEIVQAQNVTRVVSLVPVRMARMLSSPFAYLRGSAAVMAADLARGASTGLAVYACGDMHLLNFGLFASAERNLVFAINDFDEVHPGPWEWDLKRLGASAAVAAIHLGGDRTHAEAAAFACGEAYVRRMRRYAQMGFLETWYDLIDEQTILTLASPQQRRFARAIIDKAHARGPVRALARLTEEVDGQHRIVEDVPLIVRETHLPNGVPIGQAIDVMMRSYLASMTLDRRHLVSRYRLVDVARKVVGVGSVGTSCWIGLLEGADSADPLLLQVKEAQPSILTPHVPHKLEINNQGRRVVVGQRMIQGSPDIFLGWGPAEGETGLRDFYVRQLADMKGGIRLLEGDVAALGSIEDYCRLCGWALALAHAKSGDAAMISGYCGRSEAVPAALAQFAMAYLEQTLRDHDRLAAAVRAGRVAVASAEEAGTG